MADKKKEQAMVVSQDQIADGIFSMWIHTEAAQSARPGQFISMYTTDGRIFKVKNRRCNPNHRTSWKWISV